MRGRRGFTLLELLVVLLIALAFVALAGRLMLSMRRAESRTWTRAEGAEQVYRAHGHLVRDLARLQHDPVKGPMKVSAGRLSFYSLLRLDAKRFCEISYVFDAATGDLRRTAVGEPELTFRFGAGGRARFERVETQPDAGGGQPREPGVHLAFEFSASAADAREGRFSLIGSLALAVESSRKAFPFWNASPR